MRARSYLRKAVEKRLAVLLMGFLEVGNKRKSSKNLEKVCLIWAIYMLILPMNSYQLYVESFGKIQWAV